MSTPRRGRSRATEPPAAGAAAHDREPDQESVARVIALRLLTGAPRSRHQLAEALARRDVPDDVASRVLDRFTDVGLIDDAEYARTLVRSQRESRSLPTSEQAPRAMSTPRRGRSRATEPPAAGAAAHDREPDQESVARAITLRLLTGAPRSRHQLAEALARREVPDDVATRVLDRFTEVGLIDDAEYARTLVRSQRESRSLARRALAMELRRKGIDDETAANALSEVDGDLEEQSGRDLVRRRWRPGTDPTVQARRMLAMLDRKGYPPGLSRRLVAEMVDDCLLYT